MGAGHTLGVCTNLGCSAVKPQQMGPLLKIEVALCFMVSTAVSAREQQQNRTKVMNEPHKHTILLHTFDPLFKQGGFAHNPVIQ